ncbi:hypothetical protein FJZ26_00485 [Candidatus Parvarchaeota archaeon]|nr:hypothetical protein [Candidatus Parvarchaeota archaeon]
MRIENVFSRYRFTKLDVNYNRLFPDEAGNGMEHRNRVEERKKKEDMFFSIYYRLNRPVLATATSLSAFFDFHSHSPKQCLA